MLFHHTAIEHKMNMALQKFAHGATHYCKFKHTALRENALYYDNKTTINKQILCRFQKKWNTPFYLQMFCALSGRSLSWNTLVFSRFTSREHANFVGCHFFHTHVLPHHSKAHLLRYCGIRSFLGVAKSWKVTLDLVLCLNHTVQKDSRGVLGTSFRFGPTSEFSKTSNTAAQAWWKLTAKGAVLSPEKRDLRYCWRSLRLLWVLKCSWSCIVSNPFINVLSICLVPLAGITEKNSTVQRDILNYSNICWHVHHL